MVQDHAAPLPGGRENGPGDTQLGYGVTQITNVVDPFYGWFLVNVPVHHKDINLVYGPYEYRGDAVEVGRRAKERIDAEAR